MMAASENGAAFFFRIFAKFTWNILTSLLGGIIF